MQKQHLEVTSAMTILLGIARENGTSLKSLLAGILMGQPPSFLIQALHICADSHAIEFILNLIFVFRINSSQNSVSKLLQITPQPFDKWFDTLHISGMKDSDKCIQYETKDRIRFIFVEKQRSLTGVVEDLRRAMTSSEVSDVVGLVLWHSGGKYNQCPHNFDGGSDPFLIRDIINNKLLAICASKSHAKKDAKRLRKKKKAPLLQVDDDNKMYKLSDNDYSEEEQEKRGNDNTAFEALQIKPLSIPEKRPCEYDLFKDFPAPEGINNGKHETEIEWDGVSDAKNEWNFISDVDESTQNDWDVVSEVQSVMSFDTFTFSFKDAVMKEQKKKAGVQPPVQAVPHQKNNIIKNNNKSNADSPEDNEEYDADFERDGYKYGRGGKTSKMFNTNDRTVKSCPRQYRLRKN